MEKVDQIFIGKECSLARIGYANSIVVCFGDIKENEIVTKKRTIKTRNADYEIRSDYSGWRILKNDEIIASSSMSVS